MKIPIWIPMVLFLVLGGGAALVFGQALHGVERAHEEAGDLGFIKTSSGADVHWDGVPVHIIQTSTHCDAAARIAAGYVNLRSGREALVIDDFTETELAKRSALLTYGAPAECDDTGCRLVTREFAEPGTGLMRGAIVYVPSPAYCSDPFAWCPIAHEFCHVLGLDDDKVLGHLMAEKMLQGATCPQLSDADAVRLMVMY